MLFEGFLYPRAFWFWPRTLCSVASMQSILSFLQICVMKEYADSKFDWQDTLSKLSCPSRGCEHVQESSSFRWTCLGSRQMAMHLAWLKVHLEHMSGERENSSSFLTSQTCSTCTQHSLREDSTESFRLYTCLVHPLHPDPHSFWVVPPAYSRTATSLYP